MTKLMLPSSSLACLMCMIPLVSIAQINMPEFSHEGGFFDAPFSLTLSSDDENDIILYTLDGSLPSPDNLGISTFHYKNQYPENPGDPFGALLSAPYETLTYTDPIEIDDRSPLDDVISQKSTTYDFEPDYFPAGPSFKCTVIRACTWQPGNGVSEVRSHTYFVGEGSSARYGTIPVVSLALNEKDLFGYDEGIMNAGVTFDQWRLENPDSPNAHRRHTNYWRRGIEWEPQASFSLFWPNAGSAPVVNTELGLRVHGSWSRSLRRKSMRLYPRSGYGASSIAHPIFSSQEDDSFKRLILWNASGDWAKANLRDATMHRIFQPIRAYTQDAQPTVVFLNGEYYGVYHFRERYDHHYFERKSGVAESNLELLSNAELEYGSSQGLDFLEALVNSQSFADPNAYEAFKALVDIESVIDVFAATIYVFNNDWLPRNVEFWRSNVNDGANDTRWRMALVDLDRGWANRLGLDAAEVNQLQAVLDEAGTVSETGDTYTGFMAALFRNAMQNEEFEALFINRFADMMNSILLPEHANAVINAHAAEIAPYMQEHLERWGRPNSINAWNNQIGMMNEFSEIRPGFQRQHIVEYFGLDGTVDLHLDVSDEAHGSIRINTLELVQGTAGMPENIYPWSGTYFRGVPVEVTAVPAPGYKFLAWEGDTDAEEAGFVASFDGSEASLTALFGPDEQTPPAEVAIHYWHFNGAGGAAESFTADTSLVETAVITYPGTGSGFMDDVNDGTNINLQYSESPGRALRVRNPSDTRSLILEAPTTGYSSIALRYAAKRTNNGAEAQTVAYRTEAGGDFLPFDTIYPSLDYLLYDFDFGLIAEADNNPDFAIRISFEGESAGGSSGNHRFDNISISGFEGEDSPLTHFPLANADFSFDAWSSEASPGTYPEFMQFHWSYDPSGADYDVEADATAPYDCAYNLESRSRINGLGADGFSFITTGNPQHDDCASGDASPTRFVGSASIALNTEGVANAAMGWTARLVSEGARQYAVRLQYRIGSTGPYNDFELPTTFTSLDKPAGSSQNFSIEMPASLLGVPQLNLRFVYYQEAGASGNRPEIGIDDILISSSPIATPELTANALQLDGFYMTAQAGPGTAMSYTLSGSNLQPDSGHISIFIPAPYQAALDGNPYGNLINLAYSGGGFEQTVHVRLGAGAAPGFYGAAPILHTGGGAGVFELPLIGEVGFPATLGPGDVSIIGFRSVANDGFSMATWVPLPEGTGIIFTDKAWDGTSFMDNENAMTWVNDSGGEIPAGTVIKFGGPELGNGTGSSLGTVLSGDLSGLSQNGDNVFAIQGGLQQPHWVYGLSYLSQWLTEGPVGNPTSYLPAELDVPLANNVLMEVNAEYDDLRAGLNSFDAFKNLVHDVNLWRSDDEGDAFGDFDTTAFVLGDMEPCTASGGVLSAPSNRSFCVGTGSPASIAVTASGASGTYQRWGLINENGDVVASRTANSLFNLDQYPPGDYTIRYIRFEEGVNFENLNHISDFDDLEGCFAISTNGIELYLRPQPSGGAISLLSPTTVCTGPDSPDGVEVALTGNEAENHVFHLVSRSLGNQLVAAQEDPNFDLSTIAFGRHFVLAISYQNGVNAEEVNIPGTQFPYQLEGCLAYSNRVPVNLVNCLNAELENAPSPTSGPSFVSFSTPQQDRTRLDVYDLQGRLVTTLFDRVAEAGHLYRLEFDGGALPNGVYIYRLTTASEVLISKFVIAR